MMWLLLGAVFALLVLVVYLWRHWVAPWRAVEDSIRRIAAGEKPATFLVDGAERPQRVGLKLEELSKRQQDLGRQITESVSETRTILSAMQDGLLVVDPQHRITLINQTCRHLFGV